MKAVLHALGLGVVVAMLALIVSSAGAAGWVAILKDTPAEDFDEDDLHLFMTTAGTALNTEGPPRKVAWRNPVTASGGYFLELGRSVGKDRSPCKRMKVSVFSRKRSEAASNYTLCKTVDGKWRIAGMG